MSGPHTNPILVVAFCSVATLPVGGARQDEKMVPVHLEPRHQLVFDSPATRILDVKIPPGDTTLFHTHSDPILYVTMSTSQTRNQNVGAEWSGTAPAAVAAPVGQPRVVPSNPPGRIMSTTSYGDKPQTHRVNNIGSSLFRLIGITNASAGDVNPTPSADFSAKPEVDNRWFRGYRWSLSAEPTAEHRHANPVAIVAVTGGAVATVGANKTTLAQPGAFVFVESNQPHQLEGAGADAQVVEIEVRRPR